jgi:VanZ family protein
VLGRWAPVAAWMSVVFFVSSLSRLGVAGRVPDWISHPVEYAVGGVLLVRALAGAAAGPPRRTAALGAVVLATLYGVSDEYHQSFVPGRTADPADVAKDFVGATAGVLLYRRWTTVAADRASEEHPR